MGVNEIVMPTGLTGRPIAARAFPLFGDRQRWFDANKETVQRCESSAGVEQGAWIHEGSFNDDVTAGLVVDDNFAMKLPEEFEAAVGQVKPESTPITVDCPAIRRAERPGTFHDLVEASVNARFS